MARTALRAVLVPTVLLGMLLAGMPSVGADEPASTEPLGSHQEPVVTGPDNQTDPHLWGSRLAYIDTGSTYSQIGFADLADGTEGTVPNAGHRDSVPDIAGSLIVFRRVFTDGSTAARPIMLYDVEAPELGVRELAPEPGARRDQPDIGGTTVAFMQQSGPSSSQSEICVADLADIAAEAICLTSDAMSNRTPAVSPDGDVVAFAKCPNTGLGCDIYVSRRGADGVWESPRRLTDAPGNAMQPDTDGAVVTYASDAGGSWDIWWVGVDGTALHQLVLPDEPASTEFGPQVSGEVITFEREMPGMTQADLWMYRPATATLYRLTDSTTDHTLHTTWLGPDGDLLVAWAQPDGSGLGNNDIHALRAQLHLTVGPTPEQRACELLRALEEVPDATVAETATALADALEGVGHHGRATKLRQLADRIADAGPSRSATVLTAVIRATATRLLAEFDCGAGEPIGAAVSGMDSETEVIEFAR